MKNNLTQADEDRVREMARVFNDGARKIFALGASGSTPDNAVVRPVFFLVDEKGAAILPALPSKTLSAALVRMAITPKTIAVIHISEAFQAVVSSENDARLESEQVRDLPGAVEKVLCMAETRSGLLFAIEQKIDRSGVVPVLSAPEEKEWDNATGRLAGWFA